MWFEGVCILFFIKIMVCYRGQQSVRKFIRGSCR